MDKTTAKVKEGSEIANNTMLVFHNIIKAVQTSTNVTAEINLALASQTENLENVISSTEEMSHTSEKLLSIVESASLNTQYTKTSLNILSEVSEDLKYISDKLLEEISVRLLKKNPYLKPVCMVHHLDLIQLLLWIKKVDK